jgi:group I intron endonuclease
MISNYAVNTNNQSRTVGIYKITCIPNGKIYIGSSIDVHRRWKLHKTHLNTGKHNNKYLLRAFQKYGKESFMWEVIEECSQDVLWEREQYYLDMFQPFDEKGYNSARVVKAPMTGKKHTLEDRQRMSAIQKARNHKHSDEHKQYLSTLFKGRKRSLESIAQGTAKLKGQLKSEEHKAKVKEFQSSPEMVKIKKERMERVWAERRLGKDCYMYTIALYALRCGIILSEKWKGKITPECIRIKQSKAQLDPALRNQKSEAQKKRWETWYKQRDYFVFLVSLLATQSGIKLSQTQQQLPYQS